MVPLRSGHRPSGGGRPGPRTPERASHPAHAACSNKAPHPERSCGNHRHDPTNRSYDESQSAVPRMRLSQSETCLPHNSFEARYVRLKHSTPEFGETLSIAAWGHRPVLLIRLTGHLPHESRTRDGLPRKDKSRMGRAAGARADAAKQLADLEPRLAACRRNSANSSKPPSSGGLAGVATARPPVRVFSHTFFQNIFGPVTAL